MSRVPAIARTVTCCREALGLQQEGYNHEDQWAKVNCGNVTLCLLHGTRLAGQITSGRTATVVDAVRTKLK